MEYAKLFYSQSVFEDMRKNMVPSDSGTGLAFIPELDELLLLTKVVFLFHVLQ